MLRIVGFHGGYILHGASHIRVNSNRSKGETFSLCGVAISSKIVVHYGLSFVNVVEIYRKDFHHGG